MEEERRRRCVRQASYAVSSRSLTSGAQYYCCCCCCCAFVHSVARSVAFTSRPPWIPIRSLARLSGAASGARRPHSNSGGKQRRVYVRACVRVPVVRVPSFPISHIILQLVIVGAINGTALFTPSLIRSRAARDDAFSRSIGLLSDGAFWARGAPPGSRDGELRNGVAGEIDLLPRAPVSLAYNARSISPRNLHTQRLL
ncbi:hypothetical protein BD414DRAFT_27468 [Trametes punicea]|nr:hypothetical protein BD414DRAFT_27468 [Trametes punicea]